ncbi:hypothetical protein HRbin25_00113 [bacterium HR25]|jgi:predicted metal-dependent phosphoesterase TrpH|nr:hypothetical protein HRbin25_00113 [bacterium HR25]
MGSIIDLHVHTTIGSWDSMISPQRLADAAHRVGLTGMALSEHVNYWPAETLQQFREETGLAAMAAREWSTDMGHIISVGLSPEVAGIRTARDLHEAARAYGAFLILAHPFRYFPGPSSLLFGHVPNARELSIEELAKHPVFELVDAIEVLNGGCLEGENRLALEVARYLGKPVVAGSDAHAPMEVGLYATLFDVEVRSLEDLLEALRAGRFRPARRQDGVFVPITE